MLVFEHLGVIYHFEACARNMLCWEFFFSDNRLLKTYQAACPGARMGRLDSLQHYTGRPGQGGQEGGLPLAPSGPGLSTHSPCFQHLFQEGSAVSFLLNLKALREQSEGL